MYAQRRGMPLDKIVVRVTHSVVSKDTGVAANGGTLSSKVNQFEREIEFIGKGLTDSDKERLLTIANKCPVHHALESDKNIVITTLAKALE